MPTLLLLLLCMRLCVCQPRTQWVIKGFSRKIVMHCTSNGHFLTDIIGYDRCKTSSSAIAERPRDARVTSSRKIARWNF